MNKAVFLDRDGVLNNAVFVDGVALPPRSLEQFVIADGAVEQTQRLREADFLLIGVTNQPDIATGLLDWDVLEAINRVLIESLGLDEIYVCPHQSNDDCACRKPRPGSFLEAAAKYDIDLGESWTIGDRWVDVEAGKRAGVKTVLLQREYSWKPTSIGPPPPELAPDLVGSDLLDCIDHILAP